MMLCRFLEELDRNGGLSDMDIARIADASIAKVAYWKRASGMPPPETQLILSDLRYIVVRLSEYFSPAEIRVWPFAPHPQLDQERAIDLVRSRRSLDVLRILDRFDADVYL